MSADNNNANASSNPLRAGQFEGISLAESSFIPRRSNNQAQSEDQPLSSKNELEENVQSEFRGRDSQVEQKDMSVSQLQQNVGRKLRMRPAPDEFENKILQSSNIGESVDMLKKLVRDSNINGEAEDNILEDLDNLKANLGASGIGVSETGPDRQLLIQKTLYETQLEIMKSEKEKLIDDDFELNDQLKKIEEDIELKNEDINEQKKTSEREKNVLEMNITRLKNELQSLQAFEASLNNFVREIEDTKDKDANENNRIKGEIDNLKIEQQRIANSIKDSRTQRRDAKDREYDVSQEIEELQEKLNSLKDLEAKVEEIMKQLEKINAKIQEGEKNIGELNKQCKEAKELYKQERQKFEQELQNQEIERKEKEKEKEEIERYIKANQGIEDEKTPTSLAEEALRRQEERALFDQKIKNSSEVAKELNAKEERYRKWREDLESQKTESKRINDLKEELKQNIEEAKLIEGAYLRLEKEYNSQKQVLDEVTLNFRLQRKEKLKELNQKLEDAKNELAWGEKKRTGPFANFCVALVNTGLIGFLVLGILYLSNITIPGFESL